MIECANANTSKDERDQNCGDPGMGDINVMVKPSSLKDKTPMCLVNELARYNRIQHQYRLTKEDGPPHRKKFTVTLKLGDSDFEAESTSIKKAQHEAAALALRNTKYKHPPPKLLPNTRVYITPTVELNALAMKRGEPTTYTTLCQPLTPYYPLHMTSYFSSSRNSYQTKNIYECGYNQEYGFNEFGYSEYYSYPGPSYNNPYKCGLPYRISLKVGNREYVADGPSAQAARHRAAIKALDDLRRLNEVDKSESSDSKSSNDSSKSPISAVHERAFRHNLQASFEVVEERGPPHMKIFVTECRVGEQLRAVGEGNGKKLSKRRAAEKMLTLLETLPSPQRPAINNMDRKRYTKRLAYVKAHNRKVNGTGDNNGQSDGGCGKPPDEANPTTMLIEHQKKKHAKEPVFVLVNEKGDGRRKRFSFEVRVDDLTCIGAGYNKKIAKKQASANMLKLLGVEVDVQPKSESKPSPSSPTEERTVEPCTSTSTSPVNGKQIAPGVLLVPHACVTPKPVSKKSPEKEVTPTNGSSPYSEQNSPSSQCTDEEDEFLSKLNNIQKDTAKEQLIGLAEKFGYEVQIDDFPKGHHQEFLTLITVNTNPPQTCYGVGSCMENAQNEAAFNALSMISEMGVENLFTNKKIPTFLTEKEVVT